LTQHPPKPRLALTLGVTGHRPSRPATAGAAEPSLRAFDALSIERGVGSALDEALAALCSIDAETRTLFAAEPPVLSIVSALAEGSDRIAARAALARGFALDVVLPCPAAAYEATFADDESRAEFTALLKLARARLVLPLAGEARNARGDRLARAYEAAGLATLDKADILLAVWDGKPAQGRGGTGEIVDEAARQGVPVAIVDPSNGSTRLLWEPDPGGETPARRAEDIAPVPIASALPAIVRRLFAPPVLADERGGLRAYFAGAISGAAAEDEGPAGGPPSNERRRVSSPRPTLESALSGVTTENATNRMAAARFSAALEAGEAVAGLNARRYRLLLLASSLAAVVMSLFVAAATWLDDLHALASGFELGALALVSAAAFVARRRRWRNHWFAAREVVERLRLAPASWLLGSRLSAWPARPSSWPEWYALAIFREQPLFSADISERAYAPRDALMALFDGQASRHRRHEARMNALSRRLEGLGLALLATMAIINVVYLAASLADWTAIERQDAAVLAASIFLAASACTLYAARLFGDYEALARQSRRAATNLEEAKLRLLEEPDLPAMRAIAGQASQAMLSDIEAWRTAVESRRVSPS
jgi:hypothetical protein